MTASSLASPPTLIGSQQPRIFHGPTGPPSNRARVALEVAALAGLILDPWQQLVLTAMLATNDAGKWLSFECGIVVPRQNGKGSILEARELAGMFAFDEERLLIHSAHEQATSSEHFLRLLGLIEGVPEFERRVLRAPRGKGSEAIWLRGGCRILFKTRTGGGGRGLTGDFVGLDEAMILPEAMIGALVPTVAARSIIGNPQLVYAGSAVDEEIHDNGVVLSRVRDRALRQIPGLTYAEWSAGEGEPSDDDPAKVPDEIRDSPEHWGRANPGMGIRISVEHIARERGGALGPRAFNVERLGIGKWPAVDEDAGRKIPKAEWEACHDPAGEQATKAIRPVCLAFDVSPDRSTAAISLAGPRPDGKWQAEVLEHGPFGPWVVDSLEDYSRRLKPKSIKLDKVGPAGALLKEIESRRIRRVEPVTTQELVQACGVFYDLVKQATLRHIGQEELDAAVAGAGTRPLLDAWAWQRSTSTADITPLVACTLATWAAHSLRKGKPGVVDLNAVLAAAEQS